MIPTITHSLIFLLAATQLDPSASFHVPTAFTIPSSPTEGAAARSPPTRATSVATALSGLFDGWGGGTESTSSSVDVEIPPELRDEVVRPRQIRPRPRVVSGASWYTSS